MLTKRLHLDLDLEAAQCAVENDVQRTCESVNGVSSSQGFMSQANLTENLMMSSSAEVDDSAYKRQNRGADFVDVSHKYKKPTTEILSALKDLKSQYDECESSDEVVESFFPSG